MDSRSTSREVLEEMRRLSGGQITHESDVATLIELVFRGGLREQLEDLSFHAKFVAHAARVMQRNGTDAETSTGLAAEFQSGLGRFRTGLNALLQKADPADRQHFEATYLTLTPGGLQALLALCADLSWYKNLLVDQKAIRPKTVPVAGTLTWRIALAALIFGTVMWIGALHARAFIGNELLESGTFRFNRAIAPATERVVYHLFAGTAIFMIVGYITVLAAGMVFLLRSPYRLRDHGWLLMSAILLYVFVPVEVYTMVLDVRMIVTEFFGTADPVVMRELFIARIGALAGAPLVALLCYYTAILIAVLQPLRRPRGARG